MSIYALIPLEKVQQSKIQICSTFESGLNILNSKHRSHRQGLGQSWQRQFGE